MPRLVAAPASFGRLASAGEIALAVARAAAQSGWECDQRPVSDGGEGFAEVLGGRSRSTRVRGPIGQPVDAEWRMLADGRTAVVEAALACGLALVGGPEGNDAVAADTAGVGTLIAEAVRAGARRVLVAAGGTASIDGGLGALETLEPHSRLRGVELVAAYDTSVTFMEAASTFAEQKGATAAQAALLDRRLSRLAQLYRDRFGVDVTTVTGGGAGGGLVGGLVALGATATPGFEVASEVIGLADAIEDADLVVTGEGLLDEESFDARAVGRVIELAAEFGVEVVVVAGHVVGEVAEHGSHPVGVVERFGSVAAEADAAACVSRVVAEVLGQRGGRGEQAVLRSRP